MSNRQQNSVGLVETSLMRIPLPPEGFRLESGALLPELQVSYETYGALSPEKDNAIFVCHALSGDAHLAGYHEAGNRTTDGWWEIMVGPGKGIDTNHYYVICANILGGCKGTTGPSSIDPRSGKPYGSRFPQITVGDMVRVHTLLIKALGIDRLAAVVGGSFGGMQVLEWAITFPEALRSSICIASAASLSAQALAFDAVGRKAIMHDPQWRDGDYYSAEEGPDKGLALARKIGHITYLSRESMTRKFGRARSAGAPEHPFHSNFEVESYLEYQGRKFTDRFDANSYLHITQAMDEFDLEERFGSAQAAFRNIQAKMLVVALAQDWLFPPEQSLEIANALLLAGKRVSYCELDAPQGHDGFLVNIDNLGSVISAFLPWVGPRPPREEAPRPPAASRAESEARELRAKELVLVADMVRPAASVLDLGCGNGELLSMLVEKRGITGIGVDISIDNIIDVIDRGHDVFLKDLDSGLSVIPDDSYDYAIMSETLQQVHKPRFVLQEMVRVARQAIVSFPNFGKLTHRLHLWRTGRMPKGKALPFEWYETPNIHLFTLRDFIDLCKQDRIRILDVSCIASGITGRLLLKSGYCNLGADRVLVRMERIRATDTDGGDWSRINCRTCQRTIRR